MEVLGLGSRIGIWCSMFRQMANFALGLVLLTILAGSTVSAADKAERNDEFRRSKAKLVQKLRSKHDSDRIDAIRELGEYRVLDAA
jgi:hypothetical protein